MTRIHQYIKFVFAALFMWFSFNMPVFSQDFTLYQPLVWSAYLNPATVGIDETHQCTSGFQKNYWAMPAAFNTYFVSADFSLKKNKQALKMGGVGMYIITDKLGESMYKTNKFGLQYSVYVNVFSKGELRAGLGVNYSFLSIDPDRLVFADQLDPYKGQIFDVSEFFPAKLLEKNNYFDLTSGIYFRNDFNNSSKVWYNKKVLDLGFTIHHFYRSEHSLLQLADNAGFGEVLPQKMSLFAKYYCPILFWGPNITLAANPYVLLEKQGPMQNLYYGTSFNFSGLVLGASLRNQQFEKGKISTTAFHFGYVYSMPKKHDNLAINYTFALPSYNGSVYLGNHCHEISLTYLIHTNSKSVERRYGQRPTKVQEPCSNACLEKINDRPSDVCPDCDNNWRFKNNLKKSDAKRK